MNDKIRKAREVALGILKPSKKELEHGLELHSNFIVCDAYSFAPSSAVDGDVIKAAIEAGASKPEIQDMIEDMAMTRCVADILQRDESLKAWEAAGVTCIFQNAGEEGQDPMRIIKRMARFTYLTDMMHDFIQKAVTPDDIVTAKKENRHCVYLTCNGVPLTQDWVSVEEEIRYIRIFFQLGSRMMHLTYNRRNMIGDGCVESSNAGLSDFGRAVIQEMNRVGIIVDVAHCGWQTSLEAAQVSEKPVVASHSGCFSLNEHCRCKSDEVIHAIADSDGYIGISCIPAFLGGSSDIKAMLGHIDYVAKKFGVEHVAIGTDIVYESIGAESEYKKIPKRQSRAGFEKLWTANDPFFNPKRNKEEQRLSLAWTNWPIFTVGLVQRDYSDDDIQKIIGGNVLRVARAVFPNNQ